MKKIIRQPNDSGSLFPQNVRHRLPMTKGQPHDTADAMLAVCTDWMPPGEFGKFQLIFPDTTKADPLNNRWLEAMAGPNNEIEVYDLNASNFILEKELCYVVYDADWGCFVPVGSCGLTRRARATQNCLYYGSGGAYEFEVELEGTAVTHTLTVSNSWSSEPVYDGERLWITHLPFDQPELGGRPQRSGRWYRIQRIPGDLKFFKAPVGGIPPAANTLASGVTCPVWERVPGTENLQPATSGEVIKVRNWTPNAIAKDGLRLGIAGYFLGAWYAISDYCQQDSGTGSSPGGTTGSIRQSSLNQTDYRLGAGLGGVSSFSSPGIIDPDLTPSTGSGGT